MTNYFVSSVDGDDTDDGTTMDDGAGGGVGAWATIEHAVESGGLSAGDIVWVRRTHSEIPTSDIQPIYDGTAVNPIKIIAWPRPSLAGTGDFYNGLPAIVDLSITADKEKHVARYIKNDADGEQYMITGIGYYVEYDGHSNDFVVGETIDNNGTFVGIVHSVIETAANSTGIVVFKLGHTVGDIAENDALDSGGTARADVTANFGTCFLIDKIYVGSDADDGNLTLSADGDWVADMGTEYGFDDSGWTIDEAAWDADAIDIPLIDFNDDSYELYIANDLNLWFTCLNIKDSSDGSGLIRISSSPGTNFEGCILETGSNNTSAINCNGPCNIERTVIDGGGDAGVSHRGYIGYGIPVVMKDVAIYGFQAGCVSLSGNHVKYEGLNLNVERDGSCDIYLYFSGVWEGRDLWLGTEVVTRRANDCCSRTTIKAENHQKVLGAHKAFWGQGDITKLDVVAGSGDPYKRTGGADSVIQIEFNQSSGGVKNPIDNALLPIFEHEFEATTDSLSYRYYVQCEGIVAVTELFIVVEYVGAHDDSTEYVIKTQRSDEAFTARADEEDWLEFMEVTGIQPAVASKVRIKCYCSYYDAANSIYIDPMVAIS